MNDGDAEFWEILLCGCVTCKNVTYVVPDMCNELCCSLMIILKSIFTLDQLPLVSTRKHSSFNLPVQVAYQST